MKQLFLSSDFHIKTLRNKPKTDHQKACDKQRSIALHSLTNLGGILDYYIPKRFFREEENKHNRRRRIFTIENTFWGMFLQILMPDSSCQSIVHAFRIRYYQQKGKSISAANSAYCQARKRLPLAFIQRVFSHLTQQNDAIHPLVGRRVISADGTGMTAEDLAENQAMWPQYRNQKVGCGFPQLRLCALFNLYTSTTLSYRIGNKKSHELKLLREQRESFKKDDIFVGDKGFICYYDQAQLKELGVDSIIALAKRSPFTRHQATRVLSKNDYLIRLNKPQNSTQIKKRYDPDAWKAIPNELICRQIKITVSQPGFRIKAYHILTTLIDEKKYPVTIISQLYWQRWQVELRFRDIKTTLGMDILKSHTPEMVEKEILMYFIVFNVLRQLIVDSSNDHTPDQFSFKSCAQTLLSYHIENGVVNDRTGYQYRQELLGYIGDCLLYKREGRTEPRLVKRRPKPFGLLMQSRKKLNDKSIAKRP